MADFTFHQGSQSHWGNEPVAEHTRFADWLNWAGAGLSVALIAGLGIWGWQLMQRDVSGVPVVRALEGPMRIAPEDPGRARPEHPGSAVNRIAAAGTAEPPVAPIALSPAPATPTTAFAAAASPIVHATRVATPHPPLPPRNAPHQPDLARSSLSDDQTPLTRSQSVRHAISTAGHAR